MLVIRVPTSTSNIHKLWVRCSEIACVTHLLHLGIGISSIFGWQWYFLDTWYVRLIGFVNVIYMPHQRWDIIWYYSELSASVLRNGAYVRTYVRADHMTYLYVHSMEAQKANTVIRYLHRRQWVPLAFHVVWYPGLRSWKLHQDFGLVPVLRSWNWVVSFAIFGDPERF